MKKVLSILVLSAAVSGCAELQHQKGRFTATGASANVLFFEIPRDPMVSANGKVPEGASITNVNASPRDWKTVMGFFNRILGVGWAQIGGTAASN